jgi:predicted RND superfamily exporter protein
LVRGLLLAAAVSYVIQLNAQLQEGRQMQAARESQMEEAVKPLSDIPAINRFLSYCRIRTVPS